MHFVHASRAAGLAALLAAAIAGAQPFPEKPVRMIVPLPPGTASDFLARTIGQSLSDAYRQQVVVDNRPGAGGLIGSGIVAKSTPDGYTLAMIAPPHIVAPLLQKEPPYRPLDDFTAVIAVASLPNVIVVAPSVPAKNIQELIALAKAKPGQLNYATVAEAGLPAAQSDGWFGIVAPAGTPLKIVAKINADVAKILRDPETKEKFARQGAELIDDTTPAGFDKLLKSEHVRYQKLVKDTGLKPQ